jgi:cation:H+ antiporter
MSYELALNFLLIAIGIFVLIRSGVYIVRSLVEIAHFLRVSEFTLSFILMAFATTLPEFAIGINSAFSGQPLISLGNILGANILNLSLTLGLVALISGQLIISNRPKEIAASHHWFTLILGAAPLILLIDLKLSRFEGLILILLFLIYLTKLFNLRGILNNRKSFWLSRFHELGGLGIKNFFKNLLIFVVAAGFLLFSASIIIKGAQIISLKIGMSQLLAGVFVVALGTTLPELVFGLRAAFRRHPGLSLGNLFGATALNSTWILGIVALISPIKIEAPLPFFVSAVFMILILFLANLFLQTRQSISRKEGSFLVSVYLLFIVIQIISVLK